MCMSVLKLISDIHLLQWAYLCSSTYLTLYFKYISLIIKQTIPLTPQFSSSSGYFVGVFTIVSSFCWRLSFLNSCLSVPLKSFALIPHPHGKYSLHILLLLLLLQDKVEEANGNETEEGRVQRRPSVEPLVNHASKPHLLSFRKPLFGQLWQAIHLTFNYLEVTGVLSFCSDRSVSGEKKPHTHEWIKRHSPVAWSKKFSCTMVIVCRDSRDQLGFWTLCSSLLLLMWKYSTVVIPSDPARTQLHCVYVCVWVSDGIKLPGQATKVCHKNLKRLAHSGIFQYFRELWRTS